MSLPAKDAMYVCSCWDLYGGQVVLEWERPLLASWLHFSKIINLYTLNPAVTGNIVMLYNIINIIILHQILEHKLLSAKIQQIKSLMFFILSLVLNYCELQ